MLDSIFLLKSLYREAAQTLRYPSEKSPSRISPQGAALASGIVRKSGVHKNQDRCLAGNGLDERGVDMWRPQKGTIPVSRQAGLLRRQNHC